MSINGFIHKEIKIIKLFLHINSKKINYCFTTIK